MEFSILKIILQKEIDLDIPSIWLEEWKNVYLGIQSKTQIRIKNKTWAGQIFSFIFLSKFAIT